jgi:hypothetical protein
MKERSRPLLSGDVSLEVLIMISPAGLEKSSVGFKSLAFRRVFRIGRI